MDNAGLLGIIKDEESCQDSDFSGDEKDLTTAGQNANEELPSHGTVHHTGPAAGQATSGVMKSAKNHGDKAQSIATNATHKAE